MFSSFHDERLIQSQLGLLKLDSQIRLTKHDLFFCGELPASVCCYQRLEHFVKKAVVFRPGQARSSAPTSLAPGDLI